MVYRCFDFFTINFNKYSLSLNIYCNMTDEKTFHYSLNIPWMVESMLSDR